MKKSLIYLSSHRPIDDNLIEFQFPSFQKDVLSNGLTLLVLEDPKLPKVYFRLGVDFGTKNDPLQKEGCVELIANVLKKGTTNRSYQNIVEEVDFTGGHLDVDANNDFFYISGNFLKDYSDIGLELMSDVVLNPVFHEHEIEKERKKIIANIENEKSSPSFLAQRRFKKVIYSPHPYAVVKTPESIGGISREQILDLYKKFVTPSRAFLIITGDISFERAFKLTSKHFEKWQKAGQKSDQDLGLPKLSKENKVFLVDRPNSEQSTILLGTLLFNRNNIKFEKMQVTNKILGGGSSGRLFMKLREEKGFTYGAYSMMSCFKDTGGWQASAEVGSEVTEDALDTFFEIFNSMHKPVTDEELKKAKRYLIGSFPIKNETPAAVASLELQKRLYELPNDYWNSYLKKINQISKDEIMEMSQTYIQEKNMAIIVVGDANKIGDSLQKFGNIGLYNLDDEKIG